MIDWLNSHQMLVIAIAVSLATNWGAGFYHAKLEHNKGFWASAVWFLSWVKPTLEAVRGVRPDLSPQIDAFEALVIRAEAAALRIETALPAPVVPPVLPTPSVAHAGAPA